MERDWKQKEKENKYAKTMANENRTKKTLTNNVGILQLQHVVGFTKIEVYTIWRPSQFFPVSIPSHARNVCGQTHLLYIQIFFSLIDQENLKSCVFSLLLWNHPLISVDFIQMISILGEKFGYNLLQKFDTIFSYKKLYGFRAIQIFINFNQLIFTGYILSVVVYSLRSIGSINISELLFWARGFSLFHRYEKPTLLALWLEKWYSSWPIFFAQPCPFLFQRFLMFLCYSLAACFRKSISYLVFFPEFFFQKMFAFVSTAAAFYKSITDDEYETPVENQALTCIFALTLFTKMDEKEARLGTAALCMRVTEDVTCT